MQLLLSSRHSGVPEKYLANRDTFQTGDIVLYRGSSFLSSAIQYFDKAYYNHAGVVWCDDDMDRVLTLDMWSAGLACLPLSRRMDGYSDFCILRPKVSEARAKAAVREVLSYWDGKEVKYDNMLLLRVALIKKTGIDLTNLGRKDKFICSEFAQYYISLLGIETYSKINLITPEDFRRYIDQNFVMLYDDAPAPNFDHRGKHIRWSDYNI